MAKKVLLDTLEMEETAESLVEEPTAIEEEKRAKPLILALPRWLWCSALVLLVLVLSCGTLYWSIVIKKTPAATPSTVAQPVPPDPRLTTVNGFIIAVKDERGRNRILICDLSFELTAGQNQRFPQKTMEVRNIIYETVRKEIITSLSAGVEIKMRHITRYQQQAGK